ncbi:MAG TPA: GDSL-type esterase/lipase family protein, partial [Bacteroidales bacterium]|nr:GDSL-type esterase/lipase family protein [Bacteroidales bacterium]
MQRRILCFGDSNTWGFNAKNKERFPKEIRWTRKLLKMLGEEDEIIEEGLNGRNAVCEDQLKEGLKGLDYIHPCIMSHKPLDLVIIMLGTNDAKERYGLTPHNMAMGIIRVASKIRHTEAGIGGKDPEILIVSPAPIGRDYVMTEAFLSMGRDADRK